MDNKYIIDTNENKMFLEEIRKNLLDFGKKFCASDGTCYYLGDDGTPWKEYNRETYELCRMLHVYTIGKYVGFEYSDELINKAIAGLLETMRDKKHGGWYSAIDSDGKYVDDKLCYVHAFVILAASSLMLLEKENVKDLLEQALKVYDQYFWDEEEGMSRDTWNTEFSVLDSYRGLNANMHSVEAFLAVADVTGDEKYRIRCGRIIDRVIGWAKNNEWRIPEHYTSNWEPDMECNKDHPDDQFKPYGATPGHGLEWARLIVQWALSTYRDDKEKVTYYIEVAENLFCRAVEDGWNADGEPGFVYTNGWDGKPIVRDRMHWVLAEGINTAAVLYHETGKEMYAERYKEFMEYLDDTVLDHKNGSWFHQMDEDNVLKGTVWPGKPDLYHAVQATLIPYCASDCSIAVSVKIGKGYDI